MFKKEANRKILGGMLIFPALFFVSFVTILHCLLAFLMIPSSELLFSKKYLNYIPSVPLVISDLDLLCFCGLIFRVINTVLYHLVHCLYWCISKLLN